MPGKRMEYSEWDSNDGCPSNETPSTEWEFTPASDIANGDCQAEMDENDNVLFYYTLVSHNEVPEEAEAMVVE